MFFVEFKVERQRYNCFVVGTVAVECSEQIFKLLSVRNYFGNICLNLQKLELVLLCNFILSFNFAKRKIKLSLHICALISDLVHHLLQILKITCLLFDRLIDFEGICFYLLVFKRLDWFLAPIV